MSPQETFCSICGSRFGDPMGGMSWDVPAFVLTVGGTDTDGKAIPAVFKPFFEPDEFHLLRIAVTIDGRPAEFSSWKNGTRESYRAFDVHLDEEGEPQGPLHVPVHQACMQIFDHFLTTRIGIASSPDTIVDERSFWQVLSARFLSCATLGDIPDDMDVYYESSGVLPEPHDYFGGDRCRLIYWENNEDFEVLTADPRHQNETRIFMENVRIAEDVDGDGRETSYSLINLRRIWRLLGLARIGDTQKAEQSEPPSGPSDTTESRS